MHLGKPRREQEPQAYVKPDNVFLARANASRDLLLGEVEAPFVIRLAGACPGELLAELSQRVHGAEAAVCVAGLPGVVFVQLTHAKKLERRTESSLVVYER